MIKLDLRNQIMRHDIPIGAKGAIGTIADRHFSAQPGKLFVPAVLYENPLVTNIKGRNRAFVSSCCCHPAISHLSGETVA